MGAPYLHQGWTSTDKVCVVLMIYWPKDKETTALTMIYFWISPCNYEWISITINQLHIGGCCRFVAVFVIVQQFHWCMSRPNLQEGWRRLIWFPLRFLYYFWRKWQKNTVWKTPYLTMVKHNLKVLDLHQNWFLTGPVHQASSKLLKIAVILSYSLYKYLMLDTAVWSLA